MKNVRSFIESGILESYVLGNSTPQEVDLVEQMSVLFNEVRAELDSISEAFEFYAFAHAIAPDPIVKPFVKAIVDFQERLKLGEKPSFPPELAPGSKAADFSEWLNRTDMVLPPHFNDLHVKIIGYTPTIITAIVWIEAKTPAEVHDKEYEKFLVVEGTCHITVDDESYSLVPGDYFSIPLHKIHQVIVTSLFPCKVILQRAAA